MIAVSTCYALEIQPTVADKEHAERRERAFEDWIPVAESQGRFDHLVEENRMLPIFSERKDGKVRDIYVKKPDGISFWTWSSMDEAELLKKHKLYVYEGYTLISLSEHEGPTDAPRYWATWVNLGNERDVMRQMKRYGLSQAVIDAD